ncbi:MAG: DUF1697 domain-containing protein, partial [Solirubrobacterales bacterium]
MAATDGEAARTHAAFLRAVNLGATRKASKADLIDCFEGLGLTEVATFRTSGNVVFAGSGSANALKTGIERGLEARLGFEVPVFLRTRKQLGAISAKKPFPPRAASASKGKLQIAFLEKKPSGAAMKEIEALATDDDQLALDGTELYWLPRGGTQE